MLVKALKNLLTPKAEKIETTQDLRTKCLDKDTCALLLKGSKQSPNYIKDAMEKLITEFPKVAFAAVDASVLYVKGLEAEYLQEFSAGTARFVVFQKVSGTADKSKSDSSRLKTSVASLDVSVAYGPMSNLIGDVVSKKAKMQKVSTLPTIKTRTKKLEQEENAKRQRRSEQQNRKSSDTGSGGGGGGGYFNDQTSNDGTADGRRAERERRRAEHRANNPNYIEKTPEEIAEMERQRRARMEEEASKWNVAPDDAPEEGAPVSDESYDTDDWDDNDESSGTAVEDGDDDDDEDVMDLD
jgi:hypothetical protein